MGSRVELFERIRRDHDREGLSIRGLADRHGVHRRTVRQALGSALPPERKRPEGRPAPALGVYRELIDAVADVLRRRARRQHRRELAGRHAEAYCPQVHDPGVTAEVDWGEARVLIAGVLVSVGLFLMRSCFSGACFVMAFETQSQQAFLEGHVHAFEFFSGVFATCRYDNLKAAAKKTLKGRRRVENERFVAFRSHYLYESWFTLVGLEGAHEKGGVEGEVGRYRRSHLVPVPEFDSLEQLNGRLAAWCIEDLSRTITGRQQTVGELLAREIDLLRPLPAERFATWEESSCRVNQKSMVTVRRNHYSVPVRLAGLRVPPGRRTRDRGAARGPGGRPAPAVARQPAALRAAGSLPGAAREKPGALAHSLALRQEREQGRWPECLDALWQAIEGKVGALGGRPADGRRADALPRARPRR